MVTKKEFDEAQDNHKRIKAFEDNIANLKQDLREDLKADLHATFAQYFPRHDDFPNMETPEDNSFPQSSKMGENH